ncbi:MAG: hypothetical protein R6U57_01925 [Anaerolineales bacterium]
MESFGLFTLIILTTGTFIALFLILKLLFPKRLNSILEKAEGRSKRAFWLGAVNTLFFAALSLGLFALGDQVKVVSLLAFAVIGVYTLGFFMGLAGMSQLVGLRFLPEKNLHVQWIWGSLILLLACLSPFVGWFLILPYLAFRGFGAVVISYFQNRQLSQSEPVSEA